MPFTEVKLDDKALSNVLSFRLDAVRATTNGRPSPLASPSKATVSREVTDGGSTVGFALVTNGNGARKFVDLSVTQTHNGRTIYEHTVGNAFVSAWRFKSVQAYDARGARTTRYVEEIELCFGKYEGKAGGAGVNYDLEPFNDKVNA